MDLIVGGVPTPVVPIEDATQVGLARRVAQQTAQSVGFDDTDAGRVALVATELATNVLNHARGGEIHVAIVPGHGSRGVEVIAVDRGPGFDLAACLPDGYSTAGSRGEGLGAVRRQAQVMDMYADQRGAVVLARLYPKSAADADIRFGAVQQRLHDEAVCGDGWSLRIGPDAATLLVVDGLGHGEAAHDAAVACVDAFQTRPMDDPVVLMAEFNTAMTGTRGGAVAIARYDTATESLRYAGIGNIAGSLQTPDRSRGLASHPGIVGVQARRAQPFDFPNVRGQLLVMHSDGLQARWNLRDYPGLTTRHPAVIAALLHRDFTRGRDDVTVCVLTLETRR